MQLLKIEKIPVQLSACGASKSQDNIKNGYHTFNWHYFGIFHCTVHCAVLCIQAGKTAENRPFSCKNSRSRLCPIDLKQKFLEKVCCLAALGLCFTSDHALKLVSALFVSSVRNSILLYMAKIDVVFRAFFFRFPEALLSLILIFQKIYFIFINKLRSHQVTHSK